MSRRNRIFQFPREMTDQETARLLIKEYENFGLIGTFIGVTPFNFMKSLELFQIYEIIEGDPKSRACISNIRIYNYLTVVTLDEYGHQVTPDGKITDKTGVIHEPGEVLSLDNAPSGWSIDGLVVNYGEIVSAWLEQNPDDSS